MSTTVEKLLEAVAKRRMIEKTASSTQVNVAVVMQVQDGDIPLLSEMVRYADETFRAIIDYADDLDGEMDEDLAVVVKTAAAAHLRLEGLADSGSLKNWGSDGRK